MPALTLLRIVRPPSLLQHLLLCLPLFFGRHLRHRRSVVQSRRVPQDVVDLALCLQVVMTAVTEALQCSHGLLRAVMLLGQLALRAL